MPELVEVELPNGRIKPTRSIRNIIEHLGKFEYRELAIYSRCRPVKRLVLVEVKDMTPLKKIETMLEEGWSAPSLWEMVLAKPHIQNKIGQAWDDTVVISKKPFHSDDVHLEEENMIAVLFPDTVTGQFVLEKLPESSIRKTHRKLMFVLVQY